MCLPGQHLILTDINLHHHFHHVRSLRGPWQTFLKRFGVQMSHVEPVSFYDRDVNFATVLGAKKTVAWRVGVSSLHS